MSTTSGRGLVEVVPVVRRATLLRGLHCAHRMRLVITRSAHVMEAVILFGDLGARSRKTPGGSMEDGSLKRQATNCELAPLGRRGFGPPLDAPRDVRTIQTHRDSGNAPWPCGCAAGGRALPRG